MFKVNNKDTRTTPSEDISHLVLVFLLLTLRKSMPVGWHLTCVQSWQQRHQNDVDDVSRSVFQRKFLDSYHNRAGQTQIYKNDGQT